MKKINILWLSLLAICTTSCFDNYLSIDPLTVITNESYWKSESDVRAELNAAYNNIQKAYNTGFQLWYEARADNMLGNVTGATPMQQVTLNKLTATRTACDWNEWYVIISVANYGIHFIPQMNNLSELTRNHLLSEAYFLRAFAYFNLYRIWGDVPMITQPVLKRSEVKKLPVTDKAIIFQLVSDDLDKAATLVNASVGTTEVELFIYSSGALYALCTDVAMWQHDYEKALDFSQRLYDLNTYTVEDVDFADVCALANTKDNIWTLKWDYASNGANATTLSYGNSGNPLIPNLQIYNKWFAWEAEAGCLDKRRQATIDSVKYKNYTAKHAARLPTGCQTWKWSPGEHKSQAEYSECYIPIYRFADIILLRAEALYQVGRYEESLIEMNRVRKRAGLPDKDIAYYAGRQEKLYEDILQERQFELFAEGKRWFDLMRTGRVQSVMNEYFQNYIGKNGASADSYSLFTEEWQLYWPIYQDILNENELLHQIGTY